ncbi:MAG: chemotaxis protein CheD [bacterium]
MVLERLNDTDTSNSISEPVRYIHQATGATMVKVSAGEIFVTAGEELITTVLGSCVAVCMRNTRSGLGGMNHFMLPGSRSSMAEPNLANTHNSPRYGEYAMTSLIGALIDREDEIADLEAKIFGGAHVIELNSEIGRANISFAISYLKEQKIRVAALDVGSDYPRKLIYDPKSGVIRLQRLRSAYRGYVAQNERRNLNNLIASTTKPSTRP